MASPSLTYTLTNGTTADASQVMQNFNDLLNGITDGTKDLSISALTAAGTATLNGHVNLGNSSSDDLTITASLASTLSIKTTNSYNVGDSTRGLASIYFGANSQTVRILGSSSMSATWTMTLPTTAGTSNYALTTNGSGVTSWTQVGLIGSANTWTAAQIIDGSADAIQLTVQGNGTQTSNLFVCETSAGTDLFVVSGTGLATVGNGSTILTTPHVLNGGLLMQGVTTSNLSYSGGSNVTASTDYFPFFYQANYTTSSGGARGAYIMNGTSKLVGMGSNASNEIVLGDITATTGTFATTYGTIGTTGAWAIGPVAGGVIHRLNTTSYAASNQTVTLANANKGPAGITLSVTGNPTIWIPFSVNGTTYYFPGWS